MDAYGDPSVKNSSSKEKINMKKTLRLIALALVLVMSVAMLASCGAPNKDPDDAIAALEDNGYKAAKDNVIVPIALRALGVDGVKTVISGSAVIDEKFQTVTVIYFESKDDANDAWEKVQKYADDEKDEKAEDWVCKKSGAMIYYGTSAAIKAAQ
jgi:hypothetical protein